MAKASGSGSFWTSAHTVQKLWIDWPEVCFISRVGWPLESRWGPKPLSNIHHPFTQTFWRRSEPNQFHSHAYDIVINDYKSSGESPGSWRGSEAIFLLGMEPGRAMSGTLVSSEALEYGTSYRQLDSGLGLGYNLAGENIPSHPFTKMVLAWVLCWRGPGLVDQTLKQKLHLELKVTWNMVKWNDANSWRMAGRSWRKVADGK